MKHFEVVRHWCKKIEIEFFDKWLISLDHVTNGVANWFDQGSFLDLIEQWVGTNGYGWYGLYVELCGVLKMNVLELSGVWIYASFRYALLLCISAIKTRLWISGFDEHKHYVVDILRPEFQKTFNHRFNAVSKSFLRRMRTIGDTIASTICVEVIPDPSSLCAKLQLWGSILKKNRSKSVLPQSSQDTVCGRTKVYTIFGLMQAWIILSDTIHIMMMMVVVTFLETILKRS